MRSVELLIVGAGPFGLAIAAQAQASGIDYLVVGKPMDFWRSHMPAGMFLRSACDWHLDPANVHTIEAFLRISNRTPTDVGPLSRDFYLAYARWFQEQKGLAIEPVLVERLDRVGDTFQAQIENGATIGAVNVVLALGFLHFAHIPAELAGMLPAGRYAHTCHLVDFAPLAGKRCLILGGRQSAFESAALLREAGAAHVHICYRHATPRFEPSDWGRANRIVAGLAENPTWFRDLSDGEKEEINHWFWTEGRLKLEPWLWPRLDHPNVTIWPETQLAACVEQADGSLEMCLDNDAHFAVDLVIFATGYEVEMGRVPLLARGNLLGELATANGSPRLDEHLQTNIPGLFVTSMPAVQDFGLFFAFTISARVSAQLMGRGIQQRLSKGI
ncbi:MAG: NAD(P)-binding domain-containing protein [Chloroflexi bacterium]|nr:NAD(P)-binding domain-containing protein [Chloroflexota bacterium]